MALAKRDEGAKVNSNINVTPMVDVMLVLLIIFMVITPMLQKGVSVDMAKVNNPVPMQDADKEDALLVAVMRDGKIYFGSRQVSTPKQLTQKVKDRLANKMDKRVFVKADARAKLRSGGGSGGQRPFGGRGSGGSADRTEKDEARQHSNAAVQQTTSNEESCYGNGSGREAAGPKPIST